VVYVLGEDIVLRDLRGLCLVIQDFTPTPWAPPTLLIADRVTLGKFDRNFPCQTLKIRKVSGVVMGS
jgi:hypothetical protein